MQTVQAPSGDDSDIDRRNSMTDLVPSQTQRIEQEYRDALSSVADGAAKDQGVILGQQAARANLDRRIGDGIVPGPCARGND